MAEETKVRTYEPPEDFARVANVDSSSIYEEAERDYEGFWAERAKELHWFEEWDRVLDWDPPEVQWFVGGKLNVAYNCLDYQVEQGRGDKTAILWQGDEPEDSKTFTYSELKAEVERFANVLKSLGIQKGDPVAIYLPMIPELPIAMLACARIGAPHSVVFGAFSAEALRDRINDCEAKVLVTAHSYIVYGPLSNGATALMFEGTPTYPESDRWWQVVEDHKVTILYTAPTAIRAFIKGGTEGLEKHDLSSLRLLGTVGEPINPRAWEWYHEHVGGGRCPIVDTWWQTETGAIMISPLPGVTTLRPGSATRPFP